MGSRRRSSSTPLGGGVGSAEAADPNYYYGDLDEGLRSDLQQWSAYYWARVDNGTTISPGTFSFGKAQLNSPLFNPLRGVRTTLEQVGVVSSDACDGLANLTPGWGDVAMTKAFRDAMTTWKISTDSEANPTGTAVHVNLIACAPASAGTTWTVDGTNLISTQLPWQAVDKANQTPTIASSISETTQYVINKLLSASAGIAAASAGVTEAQSILTGEQNQVDRFLAGVQAILMGIGSNATAWRVDACFGVFGDLPLVGVSFDDAFVLMDSTNGNMDGPFALMTSLDARTLLLTHSSAYTADGSVRCVTGDGCATIVMTTWHNHSECWPWCTPTIIWDPPTPAGFTYFCADYGIDQYGRPRCVCTRFGTETHGTPPVTYYVREVCVCGAAGACAGTGWSPGTPPAWCGPPLDCKIQYSY